MERNYTLIGFLNLFGIVPDFVLPVFEYEGSLFFQEGNNDVIKQFGIAKEAIRDRILPLNQEIGAKIELNILSRPIYAFQESDSEIVWGNSDFFRSFFDLYYATNEVLGSMINDFLSEISMPKTKNNNHLFSRPDFISQGTGRRKTSTARVYIYEGSGNIVVNNRDISKYFRMIGLQKLVYQPLEVTNLISCFDIVCRVCGGGVSGQAGAISLGVANALQSYDKDLRTTLRRAGLLTRDSRMKERKKYGLKGARKAPQFSKR